MSNITPTVDQISQDRITHLANIYWLNVDPTKESVFNANLIEDIYTNELLNTKLVAVWQ
jgi:hypothetical protein